MNLKIKMNPENILNQSLDGGNVTTIPNLGVAA